MSTMFRLRKQLPEINLTQSNFINEGNLPIFEQEQKSEFHYQGDGKNEINQIKYDDNKQQIFINKNCYFMGVAQEVWEFKIGGYQVLD
ncbi:MAG: hypothetical protein DSM107014_03310 [Gomphosphaeria aponina SAG 52.96 = DSM 107014]|uniref:Type ISP restriction-modification enzyme LLaBIII C-terminal specificity domain-containing protein n=1 Tax=Gomphosphaeria aponina SAG 52.96 = DSM 107014 TaxID=1521640 RepID=A0A941GVL2_9CHRO|nr:hypothetical protein [Gomphosphaeria aponina SAG 52.96 = DSM 107014]